MTLPRLHLAYLPTCSGCNRTPTASQDDEEQEGGENLSKHGLEVQRLLKRAGLSESDDEPSNQASPRLPAQPCCRLFSLYADSPHPFPPPTTPLPGCQRVYE